MSFEEVYRTLHDFVRAYPFRPEEENCQECAEGEVHNLCCFAVRGETVALHQYQSVRRVGGTGVFRRVVEPFPDLADHTRAMPRALGWNGVAHLAFFVSVDRRRTWYMETNGRFWDSLQGSINAGWDFPGWVCEYLLHGRVPEPGPIRIGSATGWHAGELSVLLGRLAGRRGAIDGEPSWAVSCEPAVPRGVEPLDPFRHVPLERPPAGMDRELASRQTIGRRLGGDLGVGRTPSRD